MNEEITIIALINLVYENKAPYKILYNNEKYIFDEVCKDYIHISGLYPVFFYRTLKGKKTFKEFLNDKVEIIN